MIAAAELVCQRAGLSASHRDSLGLNWAIRSEE